MPHAVLCLIPMHARQTPTLYTYPWPLSKIPQHDLAADADTRFEKWFFAN